MNNAGRPTEKTSQALRNGDASHSLRSGGVHEYFEDQAKQIPHAVALVFEDQHLTYTALNQRANQLAHLLSRKGVGLEVRVGVCLERNIDLIISLLAILKAGGTYVPLDSGAPRERIAFMMQDAGVSVVLTHEIFIENLCGLGAIIICLNGERREIQKQQDANLFSWGHGLTAAYIVYTSGSTGTPKGIIIPHQAVTRLVVNTDYIQLHKTDGVAQVATCAFDAATFEIWGALLNGSRLIIFKKDIALAPVLFGAELQNYGVTVLFLTTALFHHMVQACPATFYSMRTLLFGGEQVDPQIVSNILNQGPPERLLHVYGPTETTTFASWQWVEKRITTDSTVPIGFPIRHTTLYPLDASGQPVTPTQVGELCIGGARLARAYVKNPGLTAEKFVPNPFSEKTGERMYQTGDLVKLHSNGALEFIGRNDFQVKLRGFRIELGEIEAVLRLQPAVQETVVTVWQEDSGDKQLVAYVTPRSSAPLSSLILRKYLTDRLPEYMVPAFFVFLDQLPLTPNGKIDRRGLPPPSPDRHDSPTPYLPPTTETEKQIVAIYQQVLNRKPIGIKDHFLELGGHSLRAVQIVARMQDVWPVPLSLDSVFRYGTVAELARYVDEQKGRSVSPPRVKPVPGGYEGPIPLTFSQERVWFMEQLYPDNLAYNFQALLHLTGNLEVAALERSLTEIIRRHEIWRTTFDVPEGCESPVQVVHPPFEVTLPVLDLQQISGQAKKAALEQIVRQEIQQSYDVTRLPLVRWKLVRKSVEEYVLIHMEHHLVHDGWSINVFLNEFIHLYRANKEGHPSPLPELPIQFEDMARFQRQWMEGEEAGAQLAYWRDKLSGPVPVLALPYDRPRPLVQTFSGSAVRRKIPRTLNEGLEELARQERSTVFMCLMTGFIVLLARYSGQEEFCLGNVFANRRWKESEGLLGMLINNVVLRADVSGNPTVVKLLRRVRELTLEANANQDLPFNQVVEAVGIDRQISGNPLFQVMFGLHDSPMPEQDIPGLSIQLELGVNNGSSKFDLTLLVIPAFSQYLGQPGKGQNHSYECVWEFNTDLFDEQTITQMAEHYEHVLNGMVAEPTRSMWEIPLLSSEEKHQQIITWNDTQTDFPREASVVGLFENQVAFRPEAVAVVSDETQLTYEQLNARANQIANHLRRQGVGLSMRVGVCLERGVDLIASLLGILKVGGVYLTLDPSHPVSRLSYLACDAGIGLILTHERYRPILSDTRAKIATLDDSHHAFDQESTQPLDISLSNGPLAYVTYTSGSTGQPKGTLIGQRSIVRLVKASNYLQLRSTDRVGNLANPAFDALTFEVWGPLLNGSTMVVFSQDEVVDPFSCATKLREQAITTMFVTTALFNQMAQEIPSGFGTVDTVLFGGELVDQKWVSRVLEANSSTRLLHVYGPTESTTFSTWHQVEKNDVQGITVPIGRPLANTQAYVVDRFQEPVPVGVYGELYVGGDGLAWGYLNQTGLTAEKFLPHANSSAPGARLYRTGDVVRWRQKGVLEFVGRRDSQIKLRGYRIELGEIETTLCRIPGVQEAKVLCREDSYGNKALVAYVVGQRETLDIGSIRTFLRERLPEYMVPKAFVVLESFPLTSNGKVDTKRLPTSNETNLIADTLYVAPRNPVEDTLAEIFQAVLGRSHVGVRDNFFDLGGHSLLATRVLNRVKKVFNLNIPLLTFFNSSNVESLANQIERLQSGKKVLEPTRDAGNNFRNEKGPIEDSLSSSINHVHEGKRVPLSFAQQRLWFLEQWDRENPVYHISRAIQFNGPINVTALEKSIKGIIARHEALRTTIEQEDGFPMQQVATNWDFSLPVIDLQGMQSRRRPREISKLASEEVRRPFDLTRAPLLRGQLLHIAPQEYVFLLTLHHIAADGWSLEVFYKELSELYNAFVTGRPSSLPPLPFQYCDYTIWQRQSMNGEALIPLLDYWKKRLAGLSVLEIPSDGFRPSAQNFRGGIEFSRIPQEEIQALRGFTQAENVTNFMTLLAVFKVLLFRYTRQTDISLGTPIAGRPVQEIENLIGLFTNTLVLRTDLSGNPPFRQLVARVREVCLGALSHQELPFEKLVEELHPERDPSRHPLFQVMFAFNNTPLTPISLQNVDCQFIQFDRAAARFDLNLMIEERDGALHCMMEFSTELFDSKQIKRLLGHYQNILRQVLADPDVAITRAPLMLESEQEHVLAQGEPAHTESALLKSINQLFQEQVQSTPDRIAIVSGNEQITYYVLNARANLLANYLKRRGVGPEVLVGLCVNRTIDMIVGMLGILKAGGAYVPLDPHYPKDRIDFILRDAQIPIVITETEWEARFDFTQSTIVSLDKEWKFIVQEASRNPKSSSIPENIAYVIYTSGSTGQPKGVIISQGNAVALLNWARSVFSLPDLAGVLASTSICFDLSVFEVFVTLSWGGTVVLVESALHLPEAQEKDRVTLLNTVPSAINDLIISPPPLRLRTINLAGEPLKTTLVAAIHSQWGVELVHDLYGPSETTTYATYARRSSIGPATIGAPLSHTAVYLLNSEGEPVPLGLIGEIVIGGPQVARGYLGCPGLTAKKFVPNSFFSHRGVRMYRTGDQARWTSGGTLQFLGRNDYQVKVKGFRIELGEIEAILSQYTTIEDVAVSCESNELEDKQLVAYVGSKEELSERELRNYLQGLLPGYMVPAKFVVLKALPHTPNGKVDRQELSRISQTVRQPMAQYAAPQTKFEQLVARTWGAVLKIEQVGVNDNFFEIGGHSLAILRVQKLLENTLDQAVSIVDLFQYPTVQALAYFLQQNSNDCRKREDQEEKTTENFKKGRERINEIFNRRNQNL